MNANAMRWIRRTGVIVNALVVLALLLAACGGAVSSPAPATTQAPASEATQSPAVESTKASVAQPTPGLDCTKVSGEATVWLMQYDPDIASWRDVAEGFSKMYPNIKLNIEPQLSWDATIGKEKDALAAKSGADVFMTGGSEVYEWSVTKQILPLTPKLWSYEDAKKILLPQFILQSQVDNQVWGVGVPDVPGDFGLIANLDDLKEAGLEPLDKFTNTEQMLHYADKLTVRKGDSIARAGLSMRDQTFSTYLLSYIADQGGQFWDNDTQKFNFNTPEAKAAMQLIVDLFQKHKVDDVKLPSADVGMRQNQVAMSYEFPFILWPGFKPARNLGFVMKPAFSGDKPAIFSYTEPLNAVIPAYTKNPDQAYCVVQYLASEEGQLLYMDATPGLSALRSLVFSNDAYKTGKGAYLKPVIEGMKAGAMRFWGPWLDISILDNDILYPNILAMVNGKTSIDEGLKQLTDQMNAQVASSRRRVPEAPDTHVYFDKLPDDLSTTSN